MTLGGCYSNPSASNFPPEQLLATEEKNIHDAIADWIEMGWDNERISQHMQQRAREVGSPPNATPNTSSIFHYRLDDHLAVWIRYYFGGANRRQEPDFGVYRCEGWLTASVGGEIQAVLSNGQWHEVTIWGIGDPLEDKP